MVRLICRPGPRPAQARVVSSGQIISVFRAHEPKPSLAPFSSPRPKPSITTSMNTPQNTPQAVRNVRRRLRRSVWNTSPQ
jgi:hypothetical protein